VEGFFGMAPLDRVNPDEVVAIGAAIQAAALSDQLRRRSIPPPPGGATVPGPAQARPGSRPPTGEHIPTQRGLADIAARSQQIEETRASPVKIDANTDPQGNDATLSLHQPRTMTAPGVRAPKGLPNPAPAEFEPPSR